MRDGEQYSAFFGEAFQRSPYAQIIVASDGLIRVANARALRLLGATEADFGERNLANFVVGDLTNFAGDLMSAVSNRRVTLPLRANQSGASARTPFHVRALNPRMRPLFEILLVEDLARPVSSVMARLNKELADANETAARERRLASELKALNASLKEFTSIAAHDLQAPLRRVKMFAAMLQESLERDEAGLSADTADALADLAATIDHMRRMVASLYALSRLEAMPAKFQAVDLGEVVETVDTQLSVMLDEAGAILEFDRLPAVSADPALMAQLLQNLIENACKYRGARSPVIRISRLPDPAPGYRSMAIEDNGVGVDPGSAEKIFAPFARLNHVRAAEGLGIGLALCRRIATLHQGSLTLDPEHSGGARFILTLPAAVQE